MGWGIITGYGISSNTARVSNLIEPTIKGMGIKVCHSMGWSIITGLGISSNTVQVSNLIRTYCNSFDFNPLSIWIRVILGHEIN